MINIIKKLYRSFVYYKCRFKYFILPNLFSRCSYSYLTVPLFKQKTFITGNGAISIGQNCVFGFKAGGFHYKGCIEIQARTEEATISIGNNVSTNNNIFICASNSIIIGENTLIGQNVTIMDFEAHGVSPDKRREVGEIGSIVIHENVWIGNNVVILKNSVIGKNTIIAAGAVVAGVFPENVIIGGIPAKIIKSL